MSTFNTAQPTDKVVCTYNEWDPLEEVIVGVIDKAVIPAPHVSMKATIPAGSWDEFLTYAGQPFPPEQLAIANREIDRFVEILEAEGVRVRRPEVIECNRGYATPDWSVNDRIMPANPRDLLLIVGDEIIESPMSWRVRYFEMFAYRRLLKEYFRAGARWVAAPRPELRDALYDQDYEVPPRGVKRFVINEEEPIFDAADFTRCGRDIFVQRSNTTNLSGIEWVRRHLAPTYNVHELEITCRQPVHIDTTFVPLAPGKAIVSPEFIDKSKLPPMFRTWEVREAPPPPGGSDAASLMASCWLSINVLSLDEKRVVVEETQEPFIRFLKDWGFTPILCPFGNCYDFGGSFHCYTADVRRRGELKSYF